MFTFFIKCQYYNITQKIKKKKKKKQFCHFPQQWNHYSPLLMSELLHGIPSWQLSLSLQVKHHNLEAPQLAPGVSLN